MKLDIGAGARPAPGFLAVDVNPWGSCDVVASAEALPFADESVTAMRAVDVLEHMSYRDTDRVLAEWARVCAPGASLYVQVPAADLIMRWYVEQPWKLTAPADLPQTAFSGAVWRLYGGHLDGTYVNTDGDFRWNAHYAGFSAQSLADALDLAGFTVRSIAINQHPNLLVDAVRR